VVEVVNSDSDAVKTDYKINLRDGKKRNLGSHEEMVLLEVRSLSKDFGGLRALQNLDFDISEHELVGLIGPNGAGKTTLFNVLTGFYRPTKGKVIYRGEDISRLGPNEIARKGIVRTFQETILSMDSTVYDNVLMGCHINFRAGVIREFLHTGAAAWEEQRMRDHVQEILEFMALAPLQSELGGNLPHGQQRAVAIAMALASNPRLLLLDEPVTGMNPIETGTMMDHIKHIKNRGITIIMVEHDMRAVMNICERIIVLNYGQKIAVGLPVEIKQNKDVIEAYLGREEE
jgi:branched-chain amino acid transport system ATP-binding protein